MQKQTILSALFMLCVLQAWATHNKSGEIIYQKTGPLSLSATVITYTKASSVNTDRDTVVICWGDGHCDKIIRINNGGQIVGPDLKMNLYSGTHTYATAGIYTIYMTDYNRSAGIININPPSSDNVPFHLEALVRMMPDAAASTHSPVFLEMPVDYGMVGRVFEHVPNAFDADGDSLVYSLAVPLSDSATFVPNYSFPDQFNPEPENQIFLDPATGIFRWSAPQFAGSYCIAIVVRSYRNGLLVEETRRDMTIEIESNVDSVPYMLLNPNILETDIVDLHVGELIVIGLSLRDADGAQQLTATATGGPFQNLFQQQAQFNTVADTAALGWRIYSEHVRDQPYQVAFKIKDDFLDYGLASFRVVRFRIREVTGVGAPVQEPNTLDIWPNPGRGALSVAIPASVRPASVLMISDARGGVIQELPIKPGQTQLNIDTEAFAPGLYNLSIISEGRIWASGRYLKL